MKIKESRSCADLSGVLGCDVARPHDRLRWSMRQVVRDLFKSLYTSSLVPLCHSGQWPVLYTTVASGKLFTQRHLRQAVVLQPGDASCPAQLYLQEQGLDADGLR